MYTEMKKNRMKTIQDSDQRFLFFLFLPVVKMDSKGSITLRKGYFLNYRTCFLLFFIVLFLNQEAETLRTGSSTKARSKSKDDLRSRSISSSSLFLHPAPKERRLSFLNHQLSLLGGKVGPESRISSKIYSHLGDSTTGTDEISSVDVPPNSDIVVGKEIPKGTRILLECQAEFPVNWIYQGDGAPQMQTNTTIPASKKKAKYSATALIGSDDGVVDSKETGEYICRNTQNPEESIRYYIFVPGKSYFIRRGGIIKLSPNDNSLRIPCSISNPDARVTILKSDKGYLTCVVNDTMNYSKKSGFTLKLVEDDENDVAGLYVCMAGVNDSYQLAEYSVIRSYENSTYEYNWEERSVIYDDEFSSELGRNDDICSPNPCGPNAICEVKKNQRTGDPFTCRCEEGYRGKAPKCRSNSLCVPSPCGPNAVCTEDSERNYPRCTCQETYIGRPPNCRPECNLNIDCHPSLNCVNNTCQNPCLSACSLDAVCTVQNHVARCSCPIGTAGDPSNGGTCHKIRLPSLQFFPFFGLRPRPPNRPRPNRPPVRLQEEPQQIFPGDSLPSTDYSEEYSAGELNTISNSCENWPCGPHSQCTPVGEFAHCKCNAGYVGLPPNCRPECMRDKDCSSTHSCVENNCKDPCMSRGKVRCGTNAQCRGRHHQAECYCPSGFRGDPLSRCTPSSGETSGESQSQEAAGMWGSTGRPRPSPPPSSSGGSNSQQESSSEEHQTTNKNPSQRPGSRPGQRPPPRPSNPQENGRPTGPISDGGNNNGGSGSSCTNFCGKNAVCVQRNSTVTCRCKQGYTGPGSDPYTECTPSRNPCHKCGPNSVCRVMGNGSPVCECQPGKLGSPPNCRDNVCRYNNDCPQEQACFKRTCADPCGRARCGQYATCKAINHFAVCACPNDPDKDPLEEGGCPPPEVSSSGRPKRPGFFPPTRFFI